MASTKQSRFPAADWLRTTLANQPYVLISNRRDAKIPGMRPPASREATNSTTPIVVYYAPSKTTFDAQHPLRLLARLMDRRAQGLFSDVQDRQNPIIFASEWGDGRLRKYLDDRKKSIKSFVARDLTTKYDVASKMMTSYNLLSDARALIDQYKRAKDKETKDTSHVYKQFLTGVAALEGRPRKKRDLKALTKSWTSGNFTAVQQVKRHGGTSGRGVLVNAAIKAYMKQHALRAPAMPPKMRNIATGSELPTLYRGVSMLADEFDKGMRDRAFRDKGYMAFSRSQDVAEYLALQHRQNMQHMIVMFRLRVTEVPRGTPWVWFAGKPEIGPGCGFKNPKYNTCFVQSETPYENEVLLPPGKLVPLGVSNWNTARRTIKIVDVAYVPADT